MYDLGGSWYITGEFDNIEANIITKEMLTKKILNKYEMQLKFSSAHLQMEYIDYNKKQDQDCHELLCQ